MTFSRNLSPSIGQPDFKSTYGSENQWSFSYRTGANELQIYLRMNGEFINFTFDKDQFTTFINSGLHVGAEEIAVQSNAAAEEKVTVQYGNKYGDFSIYYIPTDIPPRNFYLVCNDTDSVFKGQMKFTWTPDQALRFVNWLTTNQWSQGAVEGSVFSSIGQLDGGAQWNLYYDPSTNGRLGLSLLSGEHIFYITLTAEEAKGIVENLTTPPGVGIPFEISSGNLTWKLIQQAPTTFLNFKVQVSGPDGPTSTNYLGSDDVTAICKWIQSIPLASIA
jgi:hypothetical protein